MSRPPNLSEKAASFVTLQHAFHPESAESNLAAAISDQQIAENKWGAVWAEATLLLDENETLSFTNAGQPLDTEANLPTRPVQPPPPVNPNFQSEAAATSSAVASVATTSAVTEAPYRHGNFFDILFGLSLTVTAVSTTFGLELTAAVVYAVAVGFHHAALLCKDREGGRMCFPLLYGIFYLVCSILMLTDSIVLFLSVFVAELLAQIGGLLTLMVAGFKRGAEWHQYIRKVCHLVRWAFRDFHQGWEPKRIFPLFRSSTVDVAAGHSDNIENEASGNSKDETVVAQHVTWE